MLVFLSLLRKLRGEACDKDIRYIASELAKLCDMFDFTYLLDMTCACARIRCRNA